MRLGNRHVVAKIVAMQDAANRGEPQVSTIQAVSSSLRLNNLSMSGPEKDGVIKKDLGSREEEVVKDLEKRNQAGTVRNGSRTKETNLDAKNTNTPDTTVDKVESKEILDKKLLEVVEETGNKDAISNSLLATVVSGQDDILESNVELKVKDEHVSRDSCKNKSGHARTHAIVINLDDKSRFSEEVTV